MYWAIDAVVEAAPSNGRPEASRSQDQVIIPRAFPARLARSFLTFKKWPSQTCQMAGRLNIRPKQQWGSAGHF
jgi:hypothetical protein